jgi:hypothetical protein
VVSESQLIQKLKALNESLWDDQLRWPRVQEWLTNFAPSEGDVPSRERLHAMFLLSHFTFFNTAAIRELLRALFRDLIRYPVIEHIRRANNNSTDVAFLHKRFDAELEAMRFVGTGNPSDSGNHLLYYFRQENQLDRSLFVSAHQLLDADDPTGRAVRDGRISRLVFLDDFCGSGRQATDYSKGVIEKLKTAAGNVEARYHVLFATLDGLETIRKKTQFDVSTSVCELDPSFRSLSEGSRYFRNAPSGIERDFARAMCLKYGQLINPKSPLGFGKCELLIGFEHNIPNNTLPIIWSEGHERRPWIPALKRHRKGLNW